MANTKYKVCLCKNCIDALDEYYPYVIPREEIDITEVPVEECDNSDLDDYNKRLESRNKDWRAQNECTDV